MSVLQERCITRVIIFLILCIQHINFEKSKNLFNFCKALKQMNKDSIMQNKLSKFKGLSNDQ